MHPDFRIEQGHRPWEERTRASATCPHYQEMCWAASSQGPPACLPHEHAVSGAGGPQDTGRQRCFLVFQGPGGWPPGWPWEEAWPSVLESAAEESHAQEPLQHSGPRQMRSL